MTRHFRCVVFENGRPRFQGPLIRMHECCAARSSLSEKVYKFRKMDRRGLKKLVLEKQGWIQPGGLCAKLCSISALL